MVQVIFALLHHADDHYNTDLNQEFTYGNYEKRGAIWHTADGFSDCSNLRIFHFFPPSIPYMNNPGYPIDSHVDTTLDRTILPVPVPSTSPALYPYQVADYSKNGYGVWQYCGGLDYQRRLDLMPSGYANTSDTGKAYLLHFFTMSDIHLSDKETPAQGIYVGYKGVIHRAIPHRCSLQPMFSMQLSRP